MWDGAAADQTAFIPIKAVIADRAARLGKPILLLQGDSHQLRSTGRTATHGPRRAVA
jgi:hypothetical protein